MKKNMKDEEIQVNTLGERLSTSSRSDKEDIHLFAQQYLEKEIEKLAGEGKLNEIEKVDKLVDKTYKSASILIGLRDAIDSCCEEKELKDIKLAYFLEEFHRGGHINNSYTKETHELNFQKAFNYAVSSLGQESTLLGEIYPDYFKNAFDNH